MDLTKVERDLLESRRLLTRAVKAGINMKFISKKSTGRLKSLGRIGDIIDFDGRAISVSDYAGEWTLGLGVLAEIFYNWVKPSSVIESLRSLKFPEDPVQRTAGASSAKG